MLRPQFHHCCNRHGCKYGDGANCPVEAKSVPGLYSCEQCDFECTPEGEVKVYNAESI